MRSIAILLAFLLAGCYGEVGRYSEDTGTVDVPGDTDPTTDSTDTVSDEGWDVGPPPGACPTGWSCVTATAPEFGGVDILVVVDDSSSMAEEQASMVEQFPIIIGNLLAPAIDPVTGRPEHIPITDLHIGVVSTDMGTGGYVVPSCSDPVDGDDGILQHTPGVGLTGCEPSYPKFLQYDVESPDPALVEEMARAFGCIATLGTGGCGFEQQLEAALEALTTHADGQNSGFLRDDTVLMILWLTDEEDCSVLDPRIFDPDDITLGHLNIRCFYNPEMVHPVSRYVAGLEGLREGSAWPVLLGMIVGVPPNEEDCDGFGDTLDGCLDADLMQSRIDPDSPTTLVPSCNTGYGLAYPPRRFVELAQQFGHRAYVHSICQDDYEPPMSALSGEVNSLADLACEASIVDLAKHPSDTCLCISDCHVIHVLDDAGACPPLLEEWDQDGDTVPNRVLDASGSQVTACEVPAAHTRVLRCDLGCHDPFQSYQPHGEGWYYNLSYTGVACPSVSFTPGYGPPAGAFSMVACP